MSQQRHILAGTVAACIAIVLAFFTFVHPEAQGQRSRDPVLLNTDKLIAEGRHVFRFDTFGDESFWGGLLQLHRGGRPGELCGSTLGTALINLFGFVPEAWKTKVNSAITTQCPDPNNPVAGTCTMHSSSVDLSVTLNALGLTAAPSAPVFVPTPNHSHVVGNSRVNSGDIWWEVRPVLVLQQSDWPAADGSGGITSSKVMDEAEAAGRAIEVGSNFFLFFNSRMDH